MYIPICVSKCKKSLFMNTQKANSSYSGEGQGLRTEQMHDNVGRKYFFIFKSCDSIPYLKKKINF